MKRTNCVLFAYALWWHRLWRGDRCYVMWRKSDWGWFPHCLFCRLRADKKVQIISYKPKDPTRRRFPPLRFEGRVVYWDELPEE
jgi:hypothetical protein